MALNRPRGLISGAPDVWLLTHSSLTLFLNRSMSGNPALLILRMAAFPVPTLPSGSSMAFSSALHLQFFVCLVQVHLSLSPYVAFEKCPGSITC